MFRIFPFILVAIVALALAGDAVAEGNDMRDAVTTCPAEDEPGWDWTVCGNGVRGIVVKPRAIRARVGLDHPRRDRRYRVVTVAEFVAAGTLGLIDCRRTPRLIGDPAGICP